MRPTARWLALPALLLAPLLSLAGPVEDARVAVALAAQKCPACDKDGKETPAAPRPDPFRAVGSLHMPVPGSREGRQWVGSATVVGPRRADGRWDVLTALHCVPDGASSGSLLLKDARQVGVSVRAHERSSDLCWLVTEDAGALLPFALLADAAPGEGDPVWHAGYGPYNTGRKKEGWATRAVLRDGFLAVNVPVGHGDSGGGVFDRDGRLVGVVSNGPEGPPHLTKLLFCGSGLVAARVRPDAAREEPGVPPTPSAAPAKAAPCSAACTCGCGAGGPCDCNAPGRAPARTAPVAPPAARPAPTPPARCAPGG